MMNFPKVFQMHERLYVGLPGLAADTLALHEKLKFRMNLYRLREEREMEPHVLSSLLSNMLYEKR